MNSSPDIAQSVDVLIAGAGPVGLTAALLLQRLGLTVEIVDQRDGPQRAPAAHVVNARTFEVWRQIGLDLDRILAMAKDPADAGAVHWVTQPNGDIYEGPLVDGQRQGIGRVTYGNGDLYEGDFISYEDALRNADSLNDLRLKIKLEGKSSKDRDLAAGLEHLEIVK